MQNMILASWSPILGSISESTPNISRGIHQHRNTLQYIMFQDTFGSLTSTSFCSIPLNR